MHFDRPASSPPSALRPRGDVLCRSLGSSSVLVNLETNEIFELNETGARIWDLVAAHQSCDTIAPVLADEFAIDIETAREQTEHLLLELLDRGLLEA
jgi:hypothetical protein